MSIGITGNPTFAPVSNQAAYAYRAGMSILPSAEFSSYFNDFIGNVNTNVPQGFAAAIIDTGATIVTSTTANFGANGALLISDATASEGAAAYLPRSVQLTVGKRFFMEIKVHTDDVTDNIIQFGLSDLTAVVNPEDLWTTVSNNVVAFGISDGSAATTLLSDAGNTGTTVQTGVRSLVANTWHTLAIEYTGSALRGYVDGKLSQTWSGVVPTGVVLAPFVGCLNGNGAGANVNHIDYLRIVSQR